MPKKIDAYDYIIKKYNINVGRQRFVELPLSVMEGSTELAQVFAELDFNLGVEVGVGLGEYSEVLCKANPNLHLYAIDSWDVNDYPKGFHEHSAATGHSVPESSSQAFWENWHEIAVKTLSPYNCTIMRKRSMDALADFEDGSLDFVYLDAGHDFLAFTEDLHYWKKKVRVGGILAGHDYSTFPGHKMVHVKRVLEAYVPSYHLMPVFTLSRRKSFLKRDAYGNWFTVKRDNYLDERMEKYAK